MLERRFAAHVARNHIERHDELDRHRDAEARRMEELRKRFVAETWLMIADTYRKGFGYAGNDYWPTWLKSACQEFGMRTVEDWHDAACEVAAKHDNWHFLRKFLDHRATKARQQP